MKLRKEGYIIKNHVIIGYEDGWKHVFNTLICIRLRVQNCIYKSKQNYEEQVENVRTKDLES